jgi:hypothetical protein
MILGSLQNVGGGFLRSRICIAPQTDVWNESHTTRRIQVITFKRIPVELKLSSFGSRGQACKVVEIPRTSTSPIRERGQHTALL